MKISRLPRSVGLRIASGVIVFAAALLAVFAFTDAQSEAPPPADGTVTFRPLILAAKDDPPVGMMQTGNPFRMDAIELLLALEKGGYSVIDLPVYSATKTKAEKAIDKIKQDGTDADDLTLILWAGHGFKGPDDVAPDDETAGKDEAVLRYVNVYRCERVLEGGKGGECDEGLRMGPDVRDDELPALFAPIPGTKVYLMGSCWSGGLALDGAKDLNSDPASILISAAGTNQMAWSAPGWGGSPRIHQQQGHTYFGGSVVDALSDDTSTPTGKVRADTADYGKVTIDELFTYVRANTDGLLKAYPRYDPNPDPKKRKQYFQEPQLYLGQHAGSTVIFRYTVGGALLRHPANKPPATAATPQAGQGPVDDPADGSSPTCGDCPEDPICAPEAVGGDVQIFKGDASSGGFAWYLVIGAGVALAGAVLSAAIVAVGRPAKRRGA